MVEYSRVYARYVNALTYRQLPSVVVEKAKLHFLDTLGNIFAAHRMPWSRMVIKLIKEMKGEPQSTVMGEGKYPVMNAALANGTMAHGVDADDSGARPGWSHPGSCIIPAAYAAAEAMGISGEGLITAIVAGYEVGCRVDSAVYPSLRDRGFHATGVVGTIGAVTAVGKIYDLTVEEMVNAYGLAGTQAAGLDEWLTTGDMSKRLHAGKAAMNGVLAASLARMGYTGPSTVFEGEYGLLRTHSREYSLERLTMGLGTEYKILGCKFKPYACCHELCPPIRMALMLQEKHGILPESIKEIRIGLNHITAENQLKVAKTPIHAQNHPAVAVSIALNEGQMFLREFFECYDDPLVKELGMKVEVYTDPQIDAVFPSKIGTRLEIITDDGSYTLFEEDKPPISPEFVKEKFMVFAAELLKEEAIVKIRDAVDDLENLSNVAELTDHILV